MNMRKMKILSLSLFRNQTDIVAQILCELNLTPVLVSRSSVSRIYLRVIYVFDPMPLSRRGDIQHVENLVLVNKSYNRLYTNIFLLNNLSCVTAKMALQIYRKENIKCGRGIS